LFGPDADFLGDPKQLAARAAFSDQSRLAQSLTGQFTDPERQPRGISRSNSAAAIRPTGIDTATDNPRF